MIYISSGCVNSKDYKECIQVINSWGFDKIELTGNIRNFNLNEFKENYLNDANQYMAHNYFPAPADAFVMNLSSTSQTFDKTLTLIEENIQFSKLVDSNIIGLHAGFLLDPKPNEIGKIFSKTELMPREDGLKNMVNAINKVQNSHPDLKVYIENNVYSAPNKKNYQQHNPFLICDYKEASWLKEQTRVEILLDIGHLKVSCNSLGLDFEQELRQYLELSSYIHLSDNDALNDQNCRLKKNSDLFKLLEENKELLKNKIITLEVYEGKEAVIETYQNISSLMS